MENTLKILLIIFHFTNTITSNEQNQINKTVIFTILPQDKSQEYKKKLVKKIIHSLNQLDLKNDKNDLNYNHEKLIKKLNQKQ